MSSPGSPVMSPSGVTTKQQTKAMAKAARDGKKKLAADTVRNLNTLLRLTRMVREQPKGRTQGFQNPDTQEVFEFPAKELGVLTKCIKRDIISLGQEVKAPRRVTKKIEPSSGKGNYSPCVVTSGLLKFLQEGDFGPLTWDNPDGPRLIDSMPTLKSGFTSSNILKRLWYCYVRANNLSPGDQNKWFEPDQLLLDCFNNPNEPVLWFHLDHSDGTSERMLLTTAVDKGVPGATENLTGYDRLKGRMVFDPCSTLPRKEQVRVPFNMKKQGHITAQTLLPQYFIDAKNMMANGLDQDPQWMESFQELESPDTLNDIVAEHKVLKANKLSWDRYKAEMEKSSKTSRR